MAFSLVLGMSVDWLWGVIADAPVLIFGFGVGDDVWWYKRVLSADTLVRSRVDPMGG